MMTPFALAKDKEGLLVHRTKEPEQKFPKKVCCMQSKWTEPTSVQVDKKRSLQVSPYPNAYNKFGVPWTKKSDHVIYRGLPGPIPAVQTNSYRMGYNCAGRWLALKALLIGEKGESHPNKIVETAAGHARQAVLS